MMRRLLAPALALAACTSHGPGGTLATNPEDPGMMPVDPGDPKPEDPPPFAPHEATLHRLTRTQYTNTIRDLLGDVVVPADLEVDTPLHGFTTVGSTELTVSPRAAEQYEAAALDLARQIFADRDRAAAFLGCAPGNAEDPCVRDFLARFGRRAFRRPLDGAELDAWQDVVRRISGTLGDIWPALELTTAGILQSPHFLFRVELGQPDDANPGKRRFSGLEMASRLSYFIWSSMPDDALLDAAIAGELDSAAGVRTQATRLVGDPRARSALVQFFSEYFKLERLDGISKSSEMFPQMSPTMGESMKQELLLLIDDIVFTRDADLREMLDSKTTFVNSELARLYQLSQPVEELGFTKITHPDNSPRAGILTTGAFLALNAHATVTSPTFRGRFIRQYLLCQEIPPPPPGVTTTLPDEDPNQGPETLRQRLERLHLQAPSCAGCHNQMDPLGFALESFDAIGAYRTTENGLPVDTRGALDDERFNDARQLASILRERTDVSGCVSKLAYRYATGHLETMGEKRVTKALGESFAAANFSFKELVLAIATSDGFRLAGEQAP
jgi:hypothetical protein